jgi:hypothetical protein
MIHGMDVTKLSRRRILAGSAVAGLVALLGGRSAAAPARPTITVYREPT